MSEMHFDNLSWIVQEVRSDNDENAPSLPHLLGRIPKVSRDKTYNTAPVKTYDNSKIIGLQGRPVKPQVG